VKKVQGLVNYDELTKEIEASVVIMTVIDEVLAANEIYARTHELRRLTPRPERKLAS